MKTVIIEYTVLDENGKVIETNKIEVEATDELLLKLKYTLK